MLTSRYIKSAEELHTTLRNQQFYTSFIFLLNRNFHIHFLSSFHLLLLVNRVAIVSLLHISLRGRVTSISISSIVVLGSIVILIIIRAIRVRVCGKRMRKGDA